MPSRVSILAPRCRGAHPGSWCRQRERRTRFNPRAPLPGRASPANSAVRGTVKCFNPRAPLPGRASGEERRTREALSEVSILAPRCRGAHQFAHNRRKSRIFRHAFREPVLEPFSVLPLDTQSTNVVPRIQLLECYANLPFFHASLGFALHTFTFYNTSGPSKSVALKTPCSLTSQPFDSARR